MNEKRGILLIAVIMNGSLHSLAVWSGYFLAKKSVLASLILAGLTIFLKVPLDSMIPGCMFLKKLILIV